MDDMSQTMTVWTS